MNRAPARTVNVGPAVSLLQRGALAYYAWPILARYWQAPDMVGVATIGFVVLLAWIACGHGTVRRTE
jgi:hypothetical protein